MVTAKFRVAEVLSRVSAGSMLKKTTVVLMPQYDARCAEDVSFALATPAGRFEMDVDNPTALSELRAGRTFYITLTPVD